MPTRRPDALATYRAKRRFDRTPEPSGRRNRRQGRLYTIQKHAARRLHYDLRLELDGVLKSWAVTKGPSLDPSVKRLAVRTEDHPVDYATFEGRIPPGNYGAGTVLLWDRGTWEPVEDPHRGLERGKLVFELHGKRLKGRWALVRMRHGRERRENWLLIKERDNAVDRALDVTAENTTSVASGREIEQIAAAPEALWERAGSRALRATGAQTTHNRRTTTKRRSRLPRFVEPTLATLVDEVPQGDRWLFEVKFDGYRALAAVADEDVRIYTRNGLDWTRRYPAIANSLAALSLPGVLLDGEIVVIDDRGRSDFGALQNALKGEDRGMSYFVFDLLEEEGKSLRTKPLVERKKRLKTLLGDSGRRGPIFYTDHVERHGGRVLSTLCDTGFEGVIAKRTDAPYRSGRGRSWLKIKCGHEQEFVVLGWSPSSRSRPFSSLLLGVHENGELRYAGRVGAGFSAKDLATLSKRFRPTDRMAASGDVPRSIARKARWVRPELVVQIEFAGFTRDGLVRQGRFVGLREDKEVAAVVRETPKPIREDTETSKRGSAAPHRGVHLTHPDKVLFPQQGITKRDLAAYVDAVADRMLPHVAGRLVTLVRCPEGGAGECFFQRHGGRGLAKQFHELRIPERGERKTRQYLYIEDRDGLLAAVQMGVLELHIWGSRIDDVEKPDRIVFDLDPDPSLGFEDVKQGAHRLRDVLAALDLQSFALLTGGKGVHVVVPIQRRHEWPVVKDFARSVAERIVEDEPDRYVATMSKAKREGRVFIDYFRNDRTATAIAPYSTRKHAGAPVAWPVTWRELDGIAAANAVTVQSAAGRLRKADPWKDYFEIRQGLKASVLRALGLSESKRTAHTR